MTDKEEQIAFLNKYATRPNRDNITNANDILLWRWIDKIEHDNRLLKKNLSIFKNINENID